MNGAPPTMPIDLRAALVAADCDGWVNLRCLISELEQAFSSQAINVASNSPSSDSSAAEVLRPYTQEEARPGSMSATTGTGAQPLHTDGAHLIRPPRYIALACEIPTAVPTMLLQIGRNFGGAHYADARHGVFSVRDGKTAFWSPAYTDGIWRYDPLCMHPQDQRARATAARLAELAEQAVPFNWSPGDCLLINNRTVLHGRGDATDEPDRELKRLTIEVEQ